MHNSGRAVSFAPPAQAEAKEREGAGFGCRHRIELELAFERHAAVVIGADEPERQPQGHTGRIAEALDNRHRT
jgi:hypothetical protein